MPASIGEVASTGLHGANRMASNPSRMRVRPRGEPRRAGQLRRRHATCRPAWDESRVTDSDEDVVISHNWDELRRFMWDYVGIVRTDKRLERAEHRVKVLRREIHEYYSNHRISSDLIELRNRGRRPHHQSARSRRESRGLHYTLDCPEASEAARDTVLTPSPIRLDVRAARAALGALARRGRGEEGPGSAHASRYARSRLPNRVTPEHDLPRPPVPPHRHLDSQWRHAPLRPATDRSPSACGRGSVHRTELHASPARTATSSQ